MEADERKLGLLESTRNPPPPPPDRPPPSRKRSKRPVEAENATIKTKRSSDRTWRRRPDDVPESYSMRSETGNASRAPSLERAVAELATNSTASSNSNHIGDSGVALDPNFLGSSAVASNPNYLSGSAVALNSNVRSASALSTEASPPDIEQSSTTSGGTSWSLRMPWMRKRSGGSRYDVDNATEDDGVGSPLSFGGSENTALRDVMNAYDFMNMREIVGDGDNDGGYPPSDIASTKLQSRGSEGLMSNSSQVTSSRSSASVSHDSLADFKDSEWTPLDSSYGAACPVCGCVPKRIRRAVEMTIIALLIVSLVYLVVTTSIRITNDHITHNSNTDADVDLDDDFYIEWDDYNGIGDDDDVNDDQNEDEDEVVDYDDDDGGDDYRGRFLRHGMGFGFPH